MAWHPDGGTLLAVPSADNDVILYERYSWTEQGRLGGKHTGPVASVAFSPNGRAGGSHPKQGEGSSWVRLARKGGLADENIAPSGGVHIVAQLVHPIGCLLDWRSKFLYMVEGWCAM